MPRVSLNTTFARAQNDIAILENYISQGEGLSIRVQHFVGEVVMLRLFAIYEQAVKEFAFKLACNGSYRNGGFPCIYHKCKSLDDAAHQMAVLGRKKPVSLRWTKAEYVKESVRFVLNTTDHFTSEIQNHGSLINEMRIVRNHVAHRTKSTQREFGKVVRRRYGAAARLTPGAYLVSTKRHTQSNIRRYLLSVRTLLSVVSNG